MPVALRKPHDLVFERRAIPGPMPAIWPLKSGDSPMLRPHQVVHCVGRVQEVADDGVLGPGGRDE